MGIDNRTVVFVPADPTGILGYEPADPGYWGSCQLILPGYWGTSQLIRDTGARAS